MKAIWQLLGLALGFSIASSSVSAAPDIAAATEKIIIGQSVELSGQSTSKENIQGARAYFSWVNSRGGVHGKQIELLTYDDGRDPERTKKNTERLIYKDNVLALFGYRSTPTVQAILPLLPIEKVPLIATFSGSRALYQPFNPYVFNLRASYQDEVAAMVRAVAALKISRLAVLYQDDEFGRDALSAFDHYLGERNMKPLSVVSYDRKSLDVDKAVATIIAANPQVVMMACSPMACVHVIKKVRHAGLSPQFLTLSNVNSAEFFNALEGDGRGIGITQVMPYPKDIGAPIVREFQKVIKEAKDPPPLSYAALEGFVAAKLLVEGLRRAGPNATRAKLIAGLESMHEFDLGGVVVNYSANQHHSSPFVELIVIGKNGAIWR